MTTPLALVDGRSETLEISRSAVSRAGENGLAAIDMATAAIERVRHNLFVPGSSRAQLLNDLGRALWELQQIRPELAELATAANPPDNRANGA